MATRIYTVILGFDVGDGGYTVSVPALPGCVTPGESVAAAIANADGTPVTLSGGFTNRIAVPGVPISTI